MRKRWVVLGAALAACSGPPLVDMTDVDPVVYQRDLDACEAQSQSYDAAGPLVAGAVMGATMGLGAGALAGTSPVTAATMAEGYGAAAGTVAGAGVSAAAGTPVAAPPPAPRQTVAQCLAGHGYKVIAPSAR